MSMTPDESWAAVDAKSSTPGESWIAFDAKSMTPAEKWVAFDEKSITRSGTESWPRYMPSYAKPYFKG